MYDYFFTFRSVTRAQQAVLVLMRHGIAGQLERTPQKISTNGCGYGVFVRGNEVYRAAGILRLKHLVFEKVYRIKLDGYPEEAGI